MGLDVYLRGRLELFLMFTIKCKTTYTVYVFAHLNIATVKTI